jgi:hypothetical protein
VAGAGRDLLLSYPHESAAGSLDRLLPFTEISQHLR